VPNVYIISHLAQKVNSFMAVSWDLGELTDGLTWGEFVKKWLK
jgi:hypothetical protein